MDDDTIGYTKKHYFNVMTGGIPNEKNIMPDPSNGPFGQCLQYRQ
jgi:hypothetical protein